jgi:hypothetical protein
VRARSRDANHREHPGISSAKDDAERWLASQVVASARGEWVDPTLSNADQMRTKRRPDRSNQAALPLDNLPEQAAGWVELLRAALGNRTPDLRITSGSTA